MTAETTMRRKATNARKLGWEDPDRLSPEHDRIVHWLESYREDVVRLWFDDPRSRPTHWAEGDLLAIHLLVERRRKDAIALLREALRTRDQCEDASLHRALDQLCAWGGLAWPPDIGGAVGDIIDSVWERPIMHASGNSVVGFVDYFVAYREEPVVTARNVGDYYVAPRASGYSASTMLSTLLGVLNEAYNGTPSAYHVVDAVQGMFDRGQADRAVPRWQVDGRERHLCVEIKATMPPVSEVLRQLQFYKVYEEGPWAVATPEWTEAPTLLEQGIGFIPYTPGVPPRVYKPGSRLDPQG
jgi:hypothetical protein